MSCATLAVYIGLMITIYVSEVEAIPGFNVNQGSSLISIDGEVSGYGREVFVTCSYTTAQNISNVSLQWVRNNTILSSNGEIINADTSRYRVQGSSTLQSLYIRNTVRQDEGLYTCHLLYRLMPSGPQFNISKSIFLELEDYLPPPEYPVCSLSPGTVFTLGETILFTCTPGEGNPPVTLQIQLPNGEFTSSSTVYWVVTELLTSYQFVCTMSSYIFPKANRTCSSSVNIAQLRTTTLHPSTTPQLTTEKVSSMSTQSTQFEPTNGIDSSSDTGAANDSQEDTCVTTVVVSIILTIIVIPSLAANVFLLWRNRQLSKLISTHDKKPNNTNPSEEIELQETNATPDEDYIHQEYLTFHGIQGDNGTKTEHENTNPSSPDEDEDTDHCYAEVRSKESIQAKTYANYPQNKGRHGKNKNKQPKAEEINHYYNVTEEAQL